MELTVRDSQSSGGHSDGHSKISIDPVLETSRIPLWNAGAEAATAGEKLHRMPFVFKHGLATSPLFQTRHLIDVAREASKRPGDVYFDAGKIDVADKWGNIPVPDMPVDAVIERILTAQAWVIMKHVEKDPRYAHVLAEFTEFVHGLAGPERARNIINPEMLVIVSSPDRITSFHFDAEINFLVQVAGTKDVWICDPADRSILSEADVEEYHFGNITAGKFRPEFEGKARHIVLQPGDAVHIPAHAAHWVQNGSEVSVSLSLNFEYPQWRSNVYKMNHLLRKFGIKPTPPEQSPIKDTSKSAAYQAVRAAHSGFKRLRALRSPATSDRPV